VWTVAWIGDYMSDAKLTDFLPDKDNANRGTERGVYALETAIEKLGYTEPMVASADGIVLSGNKRQQVCVDKNMLDAIVIESDGTRPVIHVRTDVQSGTPQAHEIALTANRVAEVGLQWDPAIIAALDAEIGLGDWFWDDELEDIRAQDELAHELDEALSGEPDNRHEYLSSKDKIIRPVISVQTLEIFERAMKKTGKKNREEALLEVCEAYLDESFPL
jgi:hypothetical protein